VISAKVAALTEGVLKAMFMTKLKLTAAVVVLMGLLIGGGAVAHRALAAEPPDQAATAASTVITPADEAFTAQEKERRGRPKPKDKEGTALGGKLEAVDADKSSVTITTVRRGESPVSKTFTVAKDARIQKDGKAAKLADLKKGGQAMLRLAADGKTVTGMSVTTPAITVPLKGVDAGKSTITVSVGARGAKEDKTYKVAKDAKITIDGKDAALADLKEGATAAVTLGDGEVVIQIRTGMKRVREKEEE
jgi:hypothetical protein